MFHVLYLIYVLHMCCCLNIVYPTRSHFRGFTPEWQCGRCGPLKRWGDWWEVHKSLGGALVIALGARVSLASCPQCNPAIVGLFSRGPPGHRVDPDTMSRVLFTLHPIFLYTVSLLQALHCGNKNGLIQFVISISYLQMLGVYQWPVSCYPSHPSEF